MRAGPEMSPSPGARAHARERRWIDRDLLGRLPARLRPRLHDHLRSCEGCRGYHDVGIEALRVLEGDRARSRSEIDQVGAWLFAEPPAGAGLRARLAARPRLVASLGALAAAAGVAALWLAGVTAPRPAGSGAPPTLTTGAPAAHPGLPGAAAPPAPLVPAPAPGGASPPAAPEPGAPAATAPLVAQDFEDGRALGWSAGKIAKGPPRPGSRFALAGVEYAPGRTQSLGVSLESENGLFRYDGDVEVHFVYWLGETVGRKPYVEVSFREAGRRFEFVHRTREVTGGSWQEARVRLAEARPYQRRERRPTPGATVTLLKLKTNVRTEDVFFVDDVRVVRVPRER